MDMSPADIFFMQLPRNEIQLWCKETSKNLVAKKRSAIDVDEMKKLLVVFLQSCKEGRLVELQSVLRI